MHSKFLTRRIKHLTCKPQIGGSSDWISGEGVEWLFCFIKCYRSFIWEILLFIREINKPVMAIRGKNLSQLIIPIELCMSSKLFYEVSFICVKTNPYFWSRSYSKRPFLWPLPRKELTPMCSFLKFLAHIDSRGELARSFQNDSDKCSRVLNLLSSRN